MSDPFERARHHARKWLENLDTGPAGAQAGAAELRAAEIVPCVFNLNVDLGELSRHFLDLDSKEPPALLVRRGMRKWGSRLRTAALATNRNCVV